MYKQDYMATSMMSIGRMLVGKDVKREAFAPHGGRRHKQHRQWNASSVVPDSPSRQRRRTRAKRLHCKARARRRRLAA